MLMTRPPNSLMSGVGALALAVAFRGYTPFAEAAAGLATGYFVTAAAMLLNDVVDASVDAVNKPWKPIPSGRASPRAALALAAALLALALALNAALGPLPLAACAAYSALGTAYSFSRRRWWSHFLVSASTTGPVVYGWALAGAPPRAAGVVLAFSASVFATTTGREVVKAMQDVEGDSAAGYATIPTVFGLEAARKIPIACGVLGTGAGLLAVPAGAGLLYAALLSAAGAIYTWAAFEAYEGPGDRRALESARVKMLAAMALGLAAQFLYGVGPSLP